VPSGERNYVIGTQFSDMNYKADSTVGDYKTYFWDHNAKKSEIAN